MKPEIKKTLITVVKELKKKKINFAIMGSVALYIQGMDVNPHDVDILTDKKNFDKILLIYDKKRYGKVYSEKEELKESEYFCHYFKFRIGKVWVEVLADTWARNKKQEKHTEVI